jgi:hypothetical protein
MAKLLDASSSDKVGRAVGCSSHGSGLLAWAPFLLRCCPSCCGALLAAVLPHPKLPSLGALPAAVLPHPKLPSLGALPAAVLPHPKLPSLGALPAAVLPHPKLQCVLGVAVRHSRFQVVMVGEQKSQQNFHVPWVQCGCCP